MHGWCTDPYYDEFRGEVEKRAAIVKKIAEDYGLVYVPLQDTAPIFMYGAESYKKHCPISRLANGKMLFDILILTFFTYTISIMVQI